MATSTPPTEKLDPLKLVRDGTGQPQRMLEALAPDRIEIDDRNPALSMLFARDYAAYLHYHNSQDSIDSNWRPFFDRDVSVALAIASVQDVDQYRSAIAACIRELENLDNKNKNDVLLFSIRFLFGSIWTLARELDVLKEVLPGDVRLKATLSGLIRSRLAEPLTRLIAYAKAARQMRTKTGTTIDLLTVDSLAHGDERYRISIMGAFPEPWGDEPSMGLSLDWCRDHTQQCDTWAELVDSIPADSSVFGTGGTLFDWTNHCAEYALFTDIYEQFVKVYARVVVAAATELETTLTDYNHHQPHYALFLSFLKTLEHARADLNGLSKRHLDFYYRDVLRLRQRPAVPGSAHVIIELAKNSLSQELPAGTEFKGPKDGTKKPTVFITDIHSSVNRASVAQLSSLGRSGSIVNLRTHSDKDEASWHPFIVESEPAAIGFAIASHYLYLSGGVRTITMTVLFKDKPDPELELSCRLTTAAGWLTVRPEMTASQTDNKLTITLRLSGSDPAVTAYQAKVHGGRYEHSLPIMELLLKPDGQMTHRLSTYETLEIVSADLSVDVRGLRSLQLSSESGKLDPSKPFQPFGSQPKAQSSFIVGCQEAFSKKGLSEATLMPAWRGMPDPYTMTLAMCALKEGEWKSHVERTYVPSATQLISLVDDEPKLVFNADDDPYRTFGDTVDVASTSGFVKVSLTSPDIASTNARALSDFAAKLARNESAVFVPEYVPEVSQMTLDYTASQTIKALQTIQPSENSTAILYHVTSLGVAEQKLTESLFLLPRFIADDSSPHVAEFYIGLAGFSPGQNVSLLFQVEEGSADPLTLKPDDHLHWCYLSGNQWKSLNATDVIDGTDQLLSSGIVSLSVPKDATSEHTSMPAGLHWLRVAITEQPTAACRIRSVLAQAVRVTFDDRGNEADYPSGSLEAGSITKLLQPMGAVKAVSQPYSAFGGRAVEAPEMFYTRVSERLRHKDRAISLWDIERLVLENFPNVARVKCLNHTQYEPAANGGGLYNELAAGHVTVVVVPSASASSHAYPLTPYVGLDTLVEIHELLIRRMSGCVKLHVCNPEYQAVEVDVQVKYVDGYDETVSTTNLQQSITALLAPWSNGGSHLPTFGGRVYQSSVADHIETLPYVDYLTDLKLVVHQSLDKPEVVPVVECSRGIAVLTSYDSHRIKPVAEASVAADSEKCGCRP